MHKTICFALIILHIFVQLTSGLTSVDSVDSVTALIIPVENNTTVGMNNSGKAIDTSAQFEGQPEQSFPPLWIETYSEGGNLPSEDNNLSGTLDLKIGKRFRWKKPVDIYSKFSVAVDRDHYFWNNRNDIGIGSRIHLISGHASLLFLAEGSVGRFVPDDRITLKFNETSDKLERATRDLDRVIYRLEQDAMAAELDLLKRDSLQRHINQLKASEEVFQSSIDSLTLIADSLKAIPMELVKDVRAGFVFWKGWGEEGSEGDRLFPFRFWGDLYGEVIFLYTQRRIQTRDNKGEYVKSWNRYINTICSISPKIGLVLMDGVVGSVVGYGKVNSLIDIRGDWYNNLGSFSAGLRYKPFSEIDLSVFGEYNNGLYWGRQYKDDVNPNKQFFSDFRYGFTFWYGLGM
jgi:hypothetical protein